MYDVVSKVCSGVLPVPSQVALHKISCTKFERWLWRAVPLFLLVGCGSLASAQASINDQLFSTVTGDTLVRFLTVYSVDGSGSGSMALGGDSQSVNNWTTAAWQRTVRIKKTHDYGGANQFQPRAVAELVTEVEVANRCGTSCFTDSPDYRLYALFKTWQAGKSNVNDRYGKFECQIVDIHSTPANSQTTVLSSFTWTQQVEAAMEADIGDLAGLPGSDGITADDLNDQNVNQEGFWASLFIPDSENVDLLLDQLNRLATWGPFGIIQALHDTMEDYKDGSTEAWEPYTLPLGTYFGQAIVLDASPFSGFIDITKWILAVGLWWTVIWRCWEWVKSRT